MGLMEFHFRLELVEDISPWGQNPPTLGWFGLTLGWFWIEVDGEELFRYSPGILEHWSRLRPASRPMLLPYDHYPVVRYWEDLLEMLPAVLDPLPGDLAARVADAPGWEDWQRRARRFQEASQDPDSDEIYDMALRWWGCRTWGACHLAHPPRLWLWRVGESVHLRWDNRDLLVDGRPVWEAKAGERTLPVSDFLDAVRSFDARFLAEMEARVAAAGQNWSRPGIVLDQKHLQWEQQDRSTWLENALTRSTPDSSWDEIRAAMTVIEAGNRGGDAFP
ncbi:MAG: hypothetical protein H7Z41_02640 [Cytophagales bacterium]|nr:hypothetical protein [Armatimonadota bacterium]